MSPRQAGLIDPSALPVQGAPSLAGVSARELTALAVLLIPVQQACPLPASC